MHGFGFEDITFKQAINMLERMEVDESIYEDALDTSFKKSTRK